MSIPQVLAVLYALVTGLVAAFQVALALGAPWGAYAMGGGFPGRMPRPLRVAALVQAILLAALALIVLASAGMVNVALVDDWPWLINDGESPSCVLLFELIGLAVPPVSPNVIAFA